MSTTFEVAGIEAGNHRLAVGSVAEGIAAQTNPDDPRAWAPPRTLPRFEAVSSVAGGVHAVAFHPFMAAIHLAYDRHLPLRLTPDHVWLVIAQGFANHVRVHAEALRERLVMHEGRIRLDVRRDDFIRGDSGNPWPEVFAGFSQQIREHVGKRHDLVVCNFSTTTALDTIISQLVLLDTMQHYFDLSLSTMCGIPRITLAGTSDDWRALQARARVLREYELGWWIDELEPILAAFIAASEGDADRAFWSSICKRNNDSGGPYYTGWAQALFPYLIDKGDTLRLEVNPHVSSWRRDEGPAASDFPPALASTAMTWKYGFDRLALRLLGGFVGVGQDPHTLELSPALGWAVCYAD